MKIREKLKKWITWLKACPSACSSRIRQAAWLIRLKQSRIAAWLTKGCAFCRKHLFLMQLLFILLYRLALDGVYLWQMSPLYAYSGFTTDIYLPRYLLTLLVVVVFAPFVAALQQDQRPSSLLVTFLNYLYFIPLTSFVGCKGTSLAFLLCATLYWAILLFLQHSLPSVRLQPLSAQRSSKLFALLTVGSIGFVLFISGYYTHFRLVFDVINVYGVRAEAATYAIPGVFRYLLSFMTIILSVCLLHWLQQRRKGIIVLLLITYFLYFSIAAHKSVFLFLFLLLGCYVFYRPWMLDWMGGFLSCGIAACGVCSAAVSIIPMSIFMRRMMYIPVQITENCFLFFQDHPLNLFRYGIMGKLGFSEIYSTSIPYLMGEFEHVVSAANNGLLGDLFANLPIPLGLLVMPLILTICFRLLDAVSAGLPAKILISFAAFFALAFINTSWSIVLLSHGYLLACVLLYLFPRKESPIT